jgi:hypothetical protein
MERRIIASFRERFKNRRDIGSEYFEGDGDAMLWSLIRLLQEEGGQTKDNTHNTDNNMSINTRRQEAIDHSMLDKCIHNQSSYMIDWMLYRKKIKLNAS